ncbi:uncharacterized protein [Spinacia oleracea]|uniref:Granulins domain-containing protein n=1 Tax=Spinacia oleracea TaxID=3562 RepID=A0ABM3R6W1_SPIOL|nr:uncharacterized protein LOC130466789 [Spinacia oleracea]
MEGKLVFYKSKKNVVAILFLLTLVQIVTSKKLSGCGGLGCGYLIFNGCCPGFTCSADHHFTCVSDCLSVGQECGLFSPICCGSSKCSGPILGGTCK